MNRTQQKLLERSRTRSWINSERNSCRDLRRNFGEIPGRILFVFGNNFKGNSLKSQKETLVETKKNFKRNQNFWSILWRNLRRHFFIFLMGIWFNIRSISQKFPEGTLLETYKLFLQESVKDFLKESPMKLMNEFLMELIMKIKKKKLLDYTADSPVGFFGGSPGWISKGTAAKGNRKIV